MAELMLQAYSNLGDYLSLDLCSIIKKALYNKILLNHGHGHGHGHGHEESKKQNYSCWQNIPTDIMDPILQRLKPTDWIRMSCVCKSWKQSLSLYKHTCIAPAPDIPWLLLPQGRPYPKSLSFYSMSEGRFYNMKLPKPAQGGLICGYSKGWLAIVKGSSDYHPHMFLLNPVSGEQLELPSLTTVPDFYYFLDNSPKRYDASNFVHRIEVSCFGAGSTSECIIVAASLCMAEVLAFCKPGDKKWTIFEKGGDEECYEDIIFYDKMLYALSYRGKQSVVTHTIGLTDCELTLKLIPDFDLRHTVQNEPGLVILNQVVAVSYLVESVHGELLKINHMMDSAFKGVEGEMVDGEVEGHYFFYHVPLIYPQTRTRAFEIFKINPNSGHAEKLTSLGDQVLFLAARGGSSSVAVNNINGLEGNCIYFEATFYQHIYQNDWYISRESGVFYLKDGRIKRCFPSIKLPMESRMSWFTPLLK